MVGKKEEAKNDLGKVQMTTKDPALLNQATKQLEALNTVAVSGGG